MNDQILELIENIKTDYYNWTTRMGTKELSDVNVSMIKEFNESISFSEGRAYIKILNRGSVWGFIVKGDNDKLFKKGDLLKAASYNAPARNKPRGNILDGGYKIQWTGPLYL
jgi:hypothetical protein